jgi:hypothetical protein
MKLIRLTAFTSLAFALLLSTSSCEKNAEKKKQTDYQKSALVLTGAQENPATTSSALGSMDVFYSKETRTLVYSVTWSGLTGPVTAMHIHGQAPKGFNAGVVHNIITATNGLFTPGAAFGATSKVSGTLLADGVIIKEQDLLNGFYYMNIHTAANPGGEIRAQIVFQ